MPGAGKTMIAAIAIDHLTSIKESDDNGVAYIFCNYKAQADQSAPALLAALLKQLVQSQADPAGPVLQMCDLHFNRKSRPSVDEIFRALQLACLTYATVYVVVDALDECTDADDDRSQLLDKLHQLQATIDVRLLCTSRYITDIAQRFQSDPRLEVRASEEDVRRFIAGQMPRLPKYDEQLKCTIENKITEIVDGMYVPLRWSQPPTDCG